MERETDQYMNADEYVQELLINVRSLAGEYLNWKKQSVFAGEGRIRDTEVSREGILELSQILRRGKHSFEEMHRKQNSQSGDGRSSLWNICFISKKPENI